MLAAALIAAQCALCATHHATATDTIPLGLGTIRAEDGQVTATVEHSLSGITRISTACPCTGATQADSTHIVITYNPNNRLGDINEPVMVYTHGTLPAMVIHLSGTVTTDDPFPYLAHTLGRDLKVKRKDVTVSNLKDGQHRVVPLPCGNISQRPVTVAARMLPAYITIGSTPSPIPPGGEADLTFSIDGTAAPQGETRLPIIVTGIDGRPSDCMITLVIDKP